MAYPLETGTTRTATSTVINLPDTSAVASATITRAWGNTLAVYSRSSPVKIWRIPQPPTVGQLWPRANVGSG